MPAIPTADDTLETHSATSTGTRLLAERASPPSRRALLIWATLLLLILTWGAWTHRYGWQDAQGWEPEQIGQSLATGHGYSFNGPSRWLFRRAGVPADLNPNNYFPTAWQEPMNPLLIGAAFTIFGQYWGQFAVVACQAFFLFVTAILVYLIGRRYFGTWTGMVASVVLLIEPHVLHLAFDTLVTATFAGMAVIASAYTILWCLDAVSVRRALILGAVLGLGILVAGATMLFIPLAALLILVMTRSQHRLAWRAALAVPLAAAIVVSPWMIRNFLVFHEIIPSRTGFGQIALTGNAMLAETFVPGLHSCSATQPPPWTANGSIDALRRASTDRASRRALELRADECAQHTAPPGYDQMNESQRDKVYLRHAGMFALAHPAIVVKLIATKALFYFYSGWRAYIRLLALLSLLGVILARKRRASIVLVLLVLAYSVPYTLAAPYFDRYRLPIEPILLLFAIYPIVRVASYCSGLDRRSKRHGERGRADGHHDVDVSLSPRPS